MKSVLRWLSSLNPGKQPGKENIVEAIKPPPRNLLADIVSIGVLILMGAGAILAILDALPKKDAGPAELSARNMAEALHLADRTSEALETIREAEARAETSCEHWWCAELHRLRGVFLAATGADETEIEASFRAAIKTAREQKSVSLEKRAEATYAEYRREKASGLGGRGFRLPLC